MTAAVPDLGVHELVRPWNRAGVAQRGGGGRIQHLLGRQTAMTAAPLVTGLGRAIAVPAECVPPGSEDSVRPTASAATAPDVAPTAMRTRERAAFRSGRADPMICW